MNTINNKRKRLSQEKIEKTFIELLQLKDVNEITVSDICKLSKLNRSTFYSNYLDIYDLVDKIKIRMMTDFFSVYKDETMNKKHSYNFLKLFKHIKDNQIFYKSYFKLNFNLSNEFIKHIDDKEYLKFFESPKNKEYHIAFFEAGINAIIRKWLNNGCLETPEEMEEIIKTEYKNRIDFDI